MWERRCVLKPVYTTGYENNVIYIIHPHRSESLPARPLERAAQFAQVDDTVAVRVEQLKEKVGAYEYARHDRRTSLHQHVPLAKVPNGSPHGFVGRAVKHNNCSHLRAACNQFVM